MQGGLQRRLGRISRSGLRRWQIIARGSGGGSQLSGWALRPRRCPQRIWAEAEGELAAELEGVSPVWGLDLGSCSLCRDRGERAEAGRRVTQRAVGALAPRVTASSVS